MADTFSPEELGEAQALVDRKLSGKRIINPGGRIGQAYAFLINSPENLRALGDLAGRSSAGITDRPIGSSVGGGTIRQTADGFTYVDPTSRPGAAVKQFGRGGSRQQVRVEIDGRSFNVLSAPENQKGLSGVEENLQRAISRRQTESLRAGTPIKGITTLPEFRREAEVLALTGARQGVRTVKGFVNLVKFIPKAPDKLKDLVKNPSTADPRKIIKYIDAQGKNFGRMVRLSPSEAIAVVGTEVLLLKGTGSGIKATQVGRRTAAKKAVTVKFVGTQSRKGNRLKTDVIFTSNGNRIGRAKGITVVRGKRSETIVAGRSGRVGLSFPRGKFKTKQIQSFIGREKGLARRGRLVVRDTISIKKLRGKGLSGVTQDLIDKSFGRFAGRAQIRKSLKALKQLGVGKIAVVNGKKFIRTGARFPSGKIISKKAKGIRVEDFVSFSSALTKRDISLIVGKTITNERNRANFIGLIKSITDKGTKNFKISGGRLTGLQKRQYRQALSQVLSVASASLSKAKSVRRSKLSAPLINTAVAVARVALSRSRSPRQAIAKIQRAKIVSAPKFKLSSRSRSNFKVKQTALQISRARSAQQVRTILKQSNISRQRLRQILRTRQISKQTTKLVRLNLKKIGTFPKVGVRVPIPRFGRMRGRSIRNLSKAVKAYNVYAKSGRKFIKINKIPLSRKDALNVGSYAVDNTTSKSFKIVSAGRRKRIATAPASQRGYFQKTSKKFRQFRIKRGQKFSISRHIERKRYGIDTRGEKRGLSVSRYLRGSRRSFSRPARRKSGFLSRYKPQRRSFSKPKPKYRYVQGGGLFGYRRRILVRKSGSRTNVSSRPRPRPLRRRRRSSGWFGGL